MDRKRKKGMKERWVDGRKETKKEWWIEINK